MEFLERACLYGFVGRGWDGLETLAFYFSSVFFSFGRRAGDSGEGWVRQKKRHFTDWLRRALAALSLSLVIVFCRWKPCASFISLVVVRLVSDDVIFERHCVIGCLMLEGHGYGNILVRGKGDVRILRIIFCLTV